jgi:ATP-dependent RNA helicase UAP56/SUB2
MIIFVNRVDRAKKLTELLRQKLFNPICIHSQLKQEERIKNYDLFKANGSRLLVATDLFGRGIDIERVNLVINYGISQFHIDFPTERDTYLHRVGRAGRFGTKGLAINFIRADEEENEEGGTDKAVLMDIQNGFKVKVLELPKELDTSLYM